MRRTLHRLVALPIEALEPRRLLSDDCGCGGEAHGTGGEAQGSGPLAPTWACYLVEVEEDVYDEYCCWSDEMVDGKCPQDPDFDGDGDGEPDNPPPPPEPDPHPEPDPDDPDPDDPPLPNPDPCPDWKLTANLLYEGMREENLTNPPHPQHETNPGGYLPVNRGFSEWYAHWHEDGVGGGPAPTERPSTTWPWTSTRTSRTAPA